MEKRKNGRIYFASDAHLGLNVLEDPLGAERRLVRWLDSIKADAMALYLLGDMFDYWFEYKYVVPKGFTRFLGKIAEMSDAGIDIHIFIGNHDIWMFDYFEKELGATVEREAKEVVLLGSKFYLVHGDGVGDPSLSFRFMRAFFRNKICQQLYKGIHPWFTVPLGQCWSRHSRMSKLGKESEKFRGLDNEYMVQFAKKHAEHSDVQYYMFGHRHIVLDTEIADGKRILIIGDWLCNFSYAVFDGNKLEIKKFEE